MKRVPLVISEKVPETHYQRLTTHYSSQGTKGPFTAAYLCHVQNRGLASHSQGKVYIVLTVYSMLWI